MNAVASGSPVMLLVEDNPADVAFFREALEAAHAPSAVHVVGDGNEALRFLRRQEPFAGAPRPDVIVLDLNLPARNGLEVLAEMAGDPGLSAIPVAILTTSTSEASVCDIYPEGRCLYFAKTDDFRRLQDIAREIAAHAETGRGHG